MGKLQKMNESLGLVLYAMDRMQSNVEGRLQHIQRFINWAGKAVCVSVGGHFGFVLGVSWGCLPLATRFLNYIRLSQFRRG